MSRKITVSRQLTFTKSEEKYIINALKEINHILLLKMDAGAEEPTLEGTMTVDNEDKVVAFSFRAYRTT
jgi:hypothetical protein